jgi:hypothetical protein
VPTPTPLPTPTPTPTSNPGSGSSGSDDGGSGSNETHQDPAPTGPAPYIYKAAQENDTNINLSFIPGGEPYDHYLLFYTLLDSAGNAVGVPYGAQVANPTDGQIVVGGLIPGATYAFQLLPVNGNASGEGSNVFPVTLGAGRVTVRDSNQDTNLVSPIPPQVTNPDNADTIREIVDGTTVSDEGTITGQPVPAIIDYLPYPVPRPGISLTSPTCRFHTTWLWWLCFPWWLLLLLIVAALVYYYYQRQQKQKRKRRSRSNN